MRHREKTVHGVSVIYIEPSKTRLAKKAFIDGRTTWLLLPNGRVGCDDQEFFKWATVGTQQRDVRAAAALWRLGTIKRATFQKVETAYKSHNVKRARSYAVDQFKSAAAALGIRLTKEQLRATGSA